MKLHQTNESVQEYSWPKYVLGSFGQMGALKYVLDK